MKWVAISSSRGSFQPRDWTQISIGTCIPGGFLTLGQIAKSLWVSLSSFIKGENNPSYSDLLWEEACGIIERWDTYQASWNVIHCWYLGGQNIHKVFGEHRTIYSVLWENFPWALIIKQFHSFKMFWLNRFFFFFFFTRTSHKFISDVTAMLKSTSLNLNHTK